MNSVQPGMEVAASVFHPHRPGVELLRPGVTLDRALLGRLKQLGVASLWVGFDATADLDQLIASDLGRTRLAAYQQLKSDFARLGQSTVTAANVQGYRQIIMDLVLELMSNRHLAGLSDQLFAGPPRLFTHGANVAYLSVLTGLRLEGYVVQQRQRLDADHARDLTNLGIGAMLHDIGKLEMPPAAAARGVLDEPVDAEPAPPGGEPALPPYRSHSDRGYQMLANSQAPATARQIVLNHHQRWDGTGFPDLADYTQRRQRGPQCGEQIHVFSRIVAVADAVDHLIGHGRPGERPVVAALHDLTTSRFDGWFDPVVRDTMLRCLPPFPVGSHVTLSNGQQAAVVTPSLDQPCRPTVRLLDEATRQPDGSYPMLDLQTLPELDVVECAGRHVQPYLFQLPPHQPARLHRLATGT